MSYVHTPNNVLHLSISYAHNITIHMIYTIQYILHDISTADPLTNIQYSQPWSKVRKAQHPSNETPTHDGHRYI